MPEKNHLKDTEDETGANLMSWIFPEYDKHERGKLWWVFFIGISTLLILFAVLTANFLFALIVLLIDAIILSFHFKKALEVQINFFENGLAVGKKYYEWRDFDTFWIIYEPPSVKNLYFHFKTPLRPRLDIPLLNQNPLHVRKILVEYLEEDLSKESEPTSDTLSRLLKL
jgi:hypothetical protein